MLNSRTLWRTASLLVLGCLLLSGANLSAGDKKKDEPKKAGPFLTKIDQLTEEDEKDTHVALTNSPRKVYKVTFSEGKTYQIDLKSDAFDAVLRVENSEGKEVAFNDDAPGGGTLDSRLLYKAAKGGDYKIIATCLDGKPGKYSLTVVETAGGAGGATASMFKDKGMDLKAKDGKAKYDGEISDKDPVVQNHYYKLFNIQLEKGKIYRITHSSDDFDAYLFLEDPAGNKIGEDDDSGGGLNSRIVYKAAATGSYRIIATTLLNRKTGKFDLEVIPGDAKDEEEANFNERITNLAASPLAEQKKLIQEVTKRFQAKGEDLTISDARQAFRIANALEEADIELARSAYQSFTKVFEGASNKQVASISRSFAASLKKLELIGKEIVITGMTVDGKEFDLKSLKGKVVLVDFWATWCGPCIAEMPNMEKAYAKYHGKGFDIIGVSLDRSDDAIVKFNEARKIPWKSINIEDSRKLADKYGVNAIPFPVLVDASGRVVSFRARGPQLEILLNRLLGEKK